MIYILIIVSLGNCGHIEHRKTGHWDVGGVFESADNCMKLAGNGRYCIPIKE